MKIDSSYYLQQDVVALSKDLIGKIICTEINGIYTSGIITETEAYAGVLDKASHAYGDRRTRRTESMYMKGGVAYVYLCYGIHHLFNIVTNMEGIPNAILLRAIQPLEGIDQMLKRRKRLSMDKKLCAGPGTATKALGITTQQDKTDLQGDLIWLEDRGIVIREEDIITGPRVGVDYAAEDALLPYRFRIIKEIII